MRKWAVAFGLLVAVFVISRCFFTVDRTEYVYVTELGRHVATYDGGRDEDAGLHARWPWPVQSVHVLDRRLQVFDLPEAELLTHDPRGNTIDRTLTMVAYVCWRIGDADSVDRFIRRVGTPDQAKAVLSQRLSSQLGAAVGRLEMDDLVSVEAGKVDGTMRALRRRLVDDLKNQAREEYGIDLVDVRLRRHGYPPAVRPAIFERIASERNKKVAEYQGEGDQLAARIRSEAERDARQIVADARAREQQLKGRADAEADRIRNDAHARDPDFYAFLKKLENYQRILGDNKTVLLLSGHREWFDLLFNPPKPGGSGGAGKPLAVQPPRADPPSTGGP
jgi:membrane protease subunit HflC